ncbi:MAG: hypothetical protein KG003_05595 [Bacteroidetes bacterium]|nr:hypothetical protein [Bacteroidota bacterium]
MNIWKFTDNNLKLYNELRKIDSSVEGILTEIFSRINDYEPRVLSFWIQEGLKSKVETYLLRYVIPLYDLLENQNRKLVIDSLIIQLFSTICWRTFDNCIDNHVPLHRGHQTSLIALMYLFDYTKSSTSENILPMLDSHYRLMTEQSAHEKTKPISLVNIWKKCSIFLFAVESVAKLNADKINIFKTYINYCGIAHDVHDFFNDISNHVQSLPRYWMRQINHNEVYNIKFTKLLYKKVRLEITDIEKEIKFLKIEKRFPLINHLLTDVRKTFKEK